MGHVALRLSKEEGGEGEEGEEEGYDNFSNIHGPLIVNMSNYI